MSYHETNYFFIYPEFGVPVNTFIVGGKYLISVFKLTNSISVPKLKSTKLISWLKILEIRVYFN